MIYAFEPANAGGQIASWKPVHSHLFAHDDRLEPLYLDERQSLVDALRGQHVRIPDLQSLFQTWPEATSPEIPTLRLQIEQTLERLFPPGKRRSRLGAADPALFGAMWWPYASLERLCIATYLAIWLFAWDDETDSLEFSELATNFEEAQAFRAATLKSIRGYLMVDGKTKAEDIPVAQPASRISILAQFAPVGHAMVQHYTLEQRKILMQEIELFVDMSELEQRVQLSGQLPSVESYQRRRMGTSAVGVCLAIQEYALDIRLPHHIVNDPMMRSLWDGTNTIISVCNDMLSVKKEVAQSQVDSLIPLLFVAHGHNAQAAVDHATRYLEESIMQFNFAADTLLKSNAGDELFEAGLTQFINGCRYACTANLNWSLRSGRYMMNVKSLDGGISLSL